MKPKNQNTLTYILFTIYFLLLIGIIIFKLPFYSEVLSDGVRVINLIPFQGSFDSGGMIDFREIRDNILIFVPFGIYLCMLKSKWSFVKKAISIIGLTLTFEIIQFIFAIGRTDITDIIGNTLGGIIGIAIYALLFWVLKDKTNEVINMLALIVTVCVVIWFARLFYLSHFVMRGLRP